MKGQISNRTTELGAPHDVRQHAAIARRGDATEPMGGVRLLLGSIAVAMLAMLAAILWAAPGVELVALAAAIVTR